MISLPIAIATARERGLSQLTLVIAGFLLLFALFANTWSGIWFEALTLFVGAGLLSEEVESGHAQLVLLRPLTRAQWVGGRLLGAALVIAAVATVATLANMSAAQARGTGGLADRALVLPLTLAPALAWLATLAAVGAVARGWQNAGLVVAVYLGWNILKFVLPIALKKPELNAPLATIDAYFGPQELNAQHHALERVLWDVAWFFTAWLASVRLFNLRELARRRA